MLTIYEKEANFDQIDESFSKIKKLICASVGEALNEVEGELFRKLQQLGLQLLSCYVDVCGTGYEADHPLESEDGVKMRYKGLQEISSVRLGNCLNGVCPLGELVRVWFREGAPKLILYLNAYFAKAFDVNALAK